MASKRYQQIFARLRDAGETFKQLLRSAVAYKTRFCIDDRADGSRGYYDYHFNLIAVRESLDLDEQTAIVLHELRHVRHVQEGYRLMLSYSRDEMVRMTFAVEAEVQAFSALVAWRMKRHGNAQLWQTLLSFKRYADVALALEREMLKSGDELLAARKAFVQWYGSEWRRTSYFRGCSTGYLDKLDETKRVEQFNTLPDDFFDHLCVLPNGRNYGCHETEALKATRKHP